MPDDFPNQPRQIRPKGRWTGMAAVAVVGIAIGGLGVGWIANQPAGEFARLIHWHSATQNALPPIASTSPQASASLPLAQSQIAMEMRVTAVEQRLSRIDLEAEMASSNAARAEALLVAFSSRRAIERGMPLGYLEDQLKLRFGEAQPKAVATIIATSHSPITLDRLAARLETMASRLAKPPSEETGLTRVKRELANLFILRHEQASPSPDPQMRLDHARICLREGRIDDAIADVQRMPGAAQASGWMTDARRYADGQAALDTIEATALLEPHNLHDGSGQKLTEPTPAAPVAGAANSN